MDDEGAIAPSHVRDFEPETWMSVRAILPYAFVVVVSAALDQWIKWLVVSSMALYETIPVAPFLSLHHTRNTGIAFSFMSGFDETAMVVFTTAVMLFIMWLASRTEARQVFARLGFALIVGGALGNVIDRATLGYVVDYILVHTDTWSFAVFNLADAFITVGAGLVILQEIVDWRRGAGEAGSV